MFEVVKNLADINVSDTVYRHIGSGQLVKVRLLRLPTDPNASQEAQRNMRSFVVSASLCDAAGKALPDDDQGHLIAPAETLALQMQWLLVQAKENERTPAEELNAEIEAVRLKLCDQAIQWRELHELVSGFVPAPEEKQASVSLPV